MAAALKYARATSLMEPVSARLDTTGRVDPGTVRSTATHPSVAMEEHVRKAQMVEFASALMVTLVSNARLRKR